MCGTRTRGVRQAYVWGPVCVRRSSLSLVQFEVGGICAQRSEALQLLFLHGAVAVRVQGAEDLVRIHCGRAVADAVPKLLDEFLARQRLILVLDVEFVTLSQPDRDARPSVSTHGRPQAGKK
jgi:hypothetical protein